MKNSYETIQTEQESKDKIFEDLYKKVLASGGNFLEYNLPYPKVEFLRYLTKKKNLLVHGSNWDSKDLEPRQANCKSKKFGNLIAVYATEDPVLPIFYAIKDKEKFHGMAISGSMKDGSAGEDSEVLYEFEVEPEMLEAKPWSSGIIYILSKDLFEQGTDDEDVLIDEWVSKQPVKPLAKLRVGTDDFPYFGDIRPIQK